MHAQQNSNISQLTKPKRPVSYIMDQSSLQAEQEGAEVDVLRCLPSSGSFFFFCLKHQLSWNLRLCSGVIPIGALQLKQVDLKEGWAQEDPSETLLTPMRGSGCTSTSACRTGRTDPAKPPAGRWTPAPRR